MAHNQHFVHIGGSSRGDAIAKLGHALDQLGCVFALGFRRIGVIVHEVIGKELGILALEPAQHRPDNAKAQHRRPGVQERQAPAHSPGQSQRDLQLDQQKDDRVQSSNHRPPAQAHQPPQDPRRDVGPGRAHKLNVGLKDPHLHRAFDNVGPDQHFELGLGGVAVNRGFGAPAVSALDRLGLQRQIIARDVSLRRAFLAVQLAVPTRMDRIIAGDVKHPACADMLLSHNAHLNGLLLTVP